MELYVVVDVGCIECGERVEILGVFTDENHAENVRTEHEVRQLVDWEGEHHFIIKKVEVDKEYTVIYER